MFCFQCEQTSKGTGCTDFAVCGKDESTAVLQDLLVHAAKGIAQFNHRARRLGATDAELDRFLLEALFVTVTNVNFDNAAIEKTIRRAIVLRERARALYEKAARQTGKPVEEVRGPATWSPARTTEALIAQGEAVSSLTRRDRFGADIAGLQELLLYGLKGMAAYAEHALVLGHENDAVYAFISRGTVLSRGGNPVGGKIVRAESQVRRGEPARHGTARHRQHRHLRPSRAHAGARGTGEGQGDSRLRPRSERP